MGEPSKIVILEKVVEVIRRDGLVERAKTVGEELHKGLTVIASDYPHQVRLYGCCKKADYAFQVFNVRGQGTFCAFDTPDAQLRDKLLEVALSNGLHIGGCGDATVRFRPALIFEKKHAEITLDLLSKAVKAIA